MARNWSEVEADLRDAAENAPVGASLPRLAGASRLKRTLGRFLARLVNGAARAVTVRQRQYNHSLLQAVRSLAARLRDAEQAQEALRAELHELRVLVEPMHFRPGTLDAAIWNVVVHENEYRLPRRFEATDVVLDVGAHVGGFSAACLLRGAGRVYAFEPEPSNFALAEVNLARFGGRARVFRQAVWRSDGARGPLYLDASDDAANTGGGTLLGDRGEPVDWVAFDDFLDGLRREGVERVRLLKIDCEGSEFPILLTSRRLGRIDEICGEFHELNGDVPGHWRVPGVASFDRDTLRRCLERNGFRVELTGKPNSTLGIFFARRR
ncbi:MAG TPA: FkbM family methyltransferase [Gemmataceae bacterium]